MHEGRHNECIVRACVWLCVCVCVCEVGGFLYFLILLVRKFGGRQRLECACMNKCFGVSVSVCVCVCVCVFRYVCTVVGMCCARHMALSCPGTALGSPDVLLFYHPPLAPCSLRFRESVSLLFNLLSCFSAALWKHDKLLKAPLYLSLHKNLWNEYSGSSGSSSSSFSCLIFRTR